MSRSTKFLAVFSAAFLLPLLVAVVAPNASISGAVVVAAEKEDVSPNVGHEHTLIVPSMWA